jgi:hypothetical protein
VRFFGRLYVVIDKFIQSTTSLIQASKMASANNYLTQGPIDVEDSEGAEGGRFVEKVGWEVSMQNQMSSPVKQSMTFVVSEEGATFGRTGGGATYQFGAQEDVEISRIGGELLIKEVQRGGTAGFTQQLHLFDGTSGKDGSPSKGGIFVKRPSTHPLENFFRVKQRSWVLEDGDEFAIGQFGPRFKVIKLGGDEKSSSSEQEENSRKRGRGEG